MNLLALLIVGLVAGFFADKVVKNTFGTVGDILVGIAGSFIGGWIFSLFGLEPDNIIGQVISAFIGAVVLLLVINYFKGRKK